ncbi:uncharacterized protein LOC111247422 isoform X1 [Varroa destructor]|uniref:Uncharacterized protein n=1 Tax=Varroa destructor TaxID=109461 RepID=A0A7M7JMN0_VARDE|nr:uncharacterized protein LOC111247422 isoform X1 [Varroa destructor]
MLRKRMSVDFQQLANSTGFLVQGTHLLIVRYSPYSRSRCCDVFVRAACFIQPDGPERLGGSLPHLHLASGDLRGHLPGTNGHSRYLNRSSAPEAFNDQSSELARGAGGDGPTRP